MKKALIFIAMFTTIYSCCKDPIDPCTENTRVRFHNGSGVDLERVVFFDTEIGMLDNGESSEYIIVDTYGLEIDGILDFLAITKTGKSVYNDSPQKPHEFSDVPNCFTYVITNVDTVDVFSSNTLSYTILLE